MCDYTLDTSPDEVVLLEVGECVDKVRVEQSEEDEVRGDGGLGDLQAGQAAQARHGGQEAGLLLLLSSLLLLLLLLACSQACLAAAWMLR